MARAKGGGMGKVIAFPARAMTIDDILAALAERIAADHDATDADASFLAMEAEELRERYFGRAEYELIIDIPDASPYVDEIHAAVTDAMASVRNDCLEDKLRMAAEILTLKLMLRNSAE